MSTGTPGTRCALLLIDFQRDFLDDDGRMPVARDQVTPVLAATAAAIGRAQRDGDLIVKIGNEFRPRDWAGNLLRRHAAVAGSAGARWDARADVPGAPYLPKWKPDAFCNGHYVLPSGSAFVFGGCLLDSRHRHRRPDSGRPRRAGPGRHRSPALLGLVPGHGWPTIRSSMTMPPPASWPAIQIPICPAP